MLKKKTIYQRNKKLNDFKINTNINTENEIENNVIINDIISNIENQNKKHENTLNDIINTIENHETKLNETKLNETKLNETKLNENIFDKPFKIYKKVNVKQNNLYSGNVKTININKIVILSDNSVDSCNRREILIEKLKKFDLPSLNIYFGYDKSNIAQSNFYKTIKNIKSEKIYGLLDIINDFSNNKEVSDDDWLLYINDNIDSININMKYDLSKLYNVPMGADMINLSYIDENVTDMKNIKYYKATNGNIENSLYISKKACIKYINNIKTLGVYFNIFRMSISLSYLSISEKESMNDGLYDIHINEKSKLNIYNGNKILFKNKEDQLNIVNKPLEESNTDISENKNQLNIDNIVDSMVNDSLEKDISENKNQLNIDNIVDSIVNDLLETTEIDI